MQFVFGLLQGNEKMCSEAYDAFFQRYPYCYGYWKKYSDMYKKHGDLIKAAEVSNVSQPLLYCSVLSCDGVHALITY